MAEPTEIWWSAGVVRSDWEEIQFTGVDGRRRALARRAEFAWGMALVMWRRHGETEWRFEPCRDDPEAVEQWLNDDYVYIPF